MKNVLFLLALCFVFSSMDAQRSRNSRNDANKYDDNETNYEHVLKSGIISMAFGNINLRYEKTLSPSSSLNIRANYFSNLIGSDTWALGAGAGYRFYLTNKRRPAPTGMYVMPFGRMSSGRNINWYGFGANIGYQWIWDGITLDLGLGPCYTIVDVSNDLDFDDDVEGFLPNFVLSLGYAW